MAGLVLASVSMYWDDFAAGQALAVLGAAAGLAGAFFATRALQSLLYEVSAADPAAYVAGAALLVLVAALASWLPARRAARIEPQRALRG